MLILKSRRGQSMMYMSKEEADKWKKYKEETEAILLWGKKKVVGKKKPTRRKSNKHAKSNNTTQPSV